MISGVAVRIEHECQAHRFNHVVRIGVRPRRAVPRGIRISGELIPGLQEVIDAAFGQIGLRQHLNAMRNPVNHQVLQALVPERAVDRVRLHLHVCQMFTRRRIDGRDVEQFRRRKIAGGGRQSKRLLPGSRNGRGSLRFGRIIKFHFAVAGGVLPFQRRRRAHRFGRAAQIRLPPGHHHAVRSGIHDRRKLGRIPRIQHAPGNNPRRKILPAVHLQAQLRRLDLGKRRHVERIRGNTQPPTSGHIGKTFPVPIFEPARRRHANPGGILEPIDLDSIRRDRPAPVIFDPLRPLLRPIAINAAPVITGIPWHKIVRERRQRLMTRHIRRQPASPPGARFAAPRLVANEQTPHHRRHDVEPFGLHRDIVCRRIVTINFFPYNFARKGVRNETRSHHRRCSGHQASVLSRNPGRGLHLRLRPCQRR